MAFGLGSLRLALAMCVVVSHLSHADGLEHIGHYAVFGFYVLSGYLITLILNGTYASRWNQFWINRFLKIYPPYFVVALLTAIALFMIEPGDYHAAWNGFAGWRDLYTNALLIPLADLDPHQFRLVPPAWSVAVEVVNYCVLFLFVGRSRSAALLALIISIVYHGYALLAFTDWHPRYFPWYAATLPFSMGALIYFLRDLIPPRLTMTLAAGWLVNLLVVGPALSRFTYSIGFYVNAILLAAMIASMATSESRPARIDRALGDVAYPLFLVHWIVGFLMAHLFSLPNRGTIAALISIPAALVVSTLLAHYSNTLIEPIRDRIREQSIDEIAARETNNGCVG